MTTHNQQQVSPPLVKKPRHAVPDEALQALRRAINSYPKQAGFLHAINDLSAGRWTLTSANIRHWMKRGTPVAAELCPLIERATGVTCEELRPDVAWWVLRQGCNNTNTVSPSTADGAAVRPEASLPHGD